MSQIVFNKIKSENAILVVHTRTLFVGRYVVDRILDAHSIRLVNRCARRSQMSRFETHLGQRQVDSAEIKMASSIN